MAIIHEARMQEYRLAAILFRVFVFAARLIAHEYKYKFTFEFPKDRELLRIKGKSDSPQADTVQQL